MYYNKKINIKRMNNTKIYDINNVIYERFKHNLNTQTIYWLNNWLQINNKQLILTNEWTFKMVMYHMHFYYIFYILLLVNLIFYFCSIITRCGTSAKLPKNPSFSMYKIWNSQFGAAARRSLARPTWRRPSADSVANLANFL